MTLNCNTRMIHSSGFVDKVCLHDDDLDLFWTTQHDYSTHQHVSYYHAIMYHG